MMPGLEHEISVFLALIAQWSLRLLVREKRASKRTFIWWFEIKARRALNNLNEIFLNSRQRRKPVPVKITYQDDFIKMQFR